MNDQLDAFLQQVQDRIFELTRREFGEKVFERWQNPLYMGDMPHADGHAKLKGTCGDSMEMYLKVADGRVVDASFQTDGCGPSIVCGSYAAEMARGKTLEELLEFSGASILRELGGLPTEHEHCAFLAAESVKAAVDDYMIKRVRKPQEERTSD